MASIGERIQRVRKEAGLTQEEFASRIGVTKFAISYLENGHRTPSGQTVAFICREFGVRREWLETGEGPVYGKEAPPPDPLQALREEYGLNDFDMLVVKTYAEMNAAQRKALREFVEALSAAAAESPSDPKEAEEMNVKAEAEEYIEQLEEMKKSPDASSASGTTNAKETG